MKLVRACPLPRAPPPLPIRDIYERGSPGSRVFRATTSKESSGSSFQISLFTLAPAASPHLYPRTPSPLHRERRNNGWWGRSSDATKSSRRNRAVPKKTRRNTGDNPSRKGGTAAAVRRTSAKLERQIWKGGKAGRIF